MAADLALYHHIRSSASYRTRIALALKGLDYRSEIVDLVRQDHFTPAFVRRNPAQLVPVLTDGAETIAQSVAIIEYLDELHPEPPLLPRSGPADRAWVRQLALAIACDVHPLNNLRVLNYLRESGQDDEAVLRWQRHWIARGFAALETQLATSARRGTFCHGDAPTLADVCLIPQVVNAARVGIDLGAYPILQAIDARCMAMPAFHDTHPRHFPAPG